MIDDELVSIKRKDRSEEIYKILFDKDDKILLSEKIEIENYPDIMKKTLSMMEKFTIAPKSEIFLAIKHLYESNKLQQQWLGIDHAMKDFNDCESLNQTIDVWVPSNRIGKGEAQFKMLFKTVSGIPEPDFVPIEDEGYSIKYFGKNGKSSVLSGEFVNKSQTENLDTPLHNILKILNIPDRLIASPDLLKKNTGNISLDCENLKNLSTDNWDVVELSSGISSKDIKNFSEKLKSVLKDEKIENSEDYLKEFKKNIKKNIEVIKKHLLYEHKNQKGIIGICGNRAIKIDSIDQISITYIRTNSRIMFCYQECAEKKPNASLEKFLDI